MKLKISQRDKNMLVVLVGILLVFVSYYYGYRNLKEKTTVLQKQNNLLESQIDTLEKLSQNQGQYLLETQEMQTSMNEMIQKFPADIITEDIILYIRNLENKTGSYVHTLTTPGKEYIMVSADAERDVFSSMEDVTGAIAEYGFVNDGKIPNIEDMRFAQVVSDVNYSVTYKGLKQVLKEITESENRKSVDNISLVFSDSTGDLTGSMTVNYFVLSGTGREYLQPTVTGTSHGVDCIFGGLKSNKIEAETVETEQE